MGLVVGWTALPACLGCCHAVRKGTALGLALHAGVFLVGEIILFPLLLRTSAWLTALLVVDDKSSNTC